MMKLVAFHSVSLNPADFVLCSLSVVGEHSGLKPFTAEHKVATGPTSRQGLAVVVVVGGVLPGVEAGLHRVDLESMALS